MGNLTDMQIKAWINANERFQGRADGNGLYLCYREDYKSPVWRFRYKLSGKPRIMLIGSYADLTLSKAREITRELSARVSLGYDVADEKQARKSEALAKINGAKNAVTVLDVANAFYSKHILGRVKYPNYVRRAIDKDISPAIGKMLISDVNAVHVDDLIQKVMDRNAPTAANDVLSIMKRIFDYAIRRRHIMVNPAGAFKTTDAGGYEESRDRWLTRTEIISFFQAMQLAKGFSRENELAIKLLLVLCCRKMELCAAPWSEFDLTNAVWHLSGERTKNGDDIDIPLPPAALEWLNELKILSCNSRWVLPSRAMKNRQLPHIAESTLPVAVGKIFRFMPPDTHRFTVHDMRRTARTHLGMLGVDPIIAERCLNHRVQGIQGVYDRHHYFEERQRALCLWADLLVALENGGEYNVTPIKKRVSGGIK